MTFTKTIFIAVIFGFIIALMGEFSIGILAVIAVPEAYFHWTKEVLFKGSGLLILDFIQQFMGYGLLGIFAGIILGNITPLKWLITSTVCYLTVIVYFTVQMRTIPLPYWSSNTAPWWLSLSAVVLPVCIIMASYFAVRQHNQGLVLDAVKLRHQT